MAQPSSHSTSSSTQHTSDELELAERKQPVVHISEQAEKGPFDGVEVDDNDPDFAGTESTSLDKLNMQRMGKSQLLIRQFRLLSTISFTAIAFGAWQIGIFVITQGLVDGGRAGMIWSLVWNFVGFCPVYLSLAEMSSMAPTAGGEYHWVSEFAHPAWQRPLSYITGWTTTLAWQAGNAMGVFLIGTLIQVIILENDMMYMFPAWHGSLLTMACILLTALINVFCTKYIPKLQNAIFGLTLLAYAGLIVPIWVGAPKASAKQVFTEFQNKGGWSSLGYAVLVGQMPGISQQVGVDMGVHMSEEVKNASKAVPRAMLATYVLNFCMILPMLITLCFAMPDMQAALDDISYYPAVYVLRQSMSVPWLTTMLAVICAILMCGNVSYLTATTRDLFAFARDGGLPFSDWIAKVDRKRHIPLNAIIVTSLFSFALSLIYIGSITAFYALTSLFTVALLQGYIFAIASILWRRIRIPQTLPPTQFNLGRYGVPINIVAIIYCLWSFFWCFWPMYNPPTPDDFNWASVLFVGTIIFAVAYFPFGPRKKYLGPVALVRNL